jgi:hypothetical protein
MGPVVFGAGGFFLAAMTGERAAATGCDPGRSSAGAEREPVAGAELCNASIFAAKAVTRSDNFFRSAFWASMSSIVDRRESAIFRLKASKSF